MALSTLFGDSGTTGGVVAAALSVSPDLFLRVDQGRQALPIDLAAEIASFLGVEVGTVIGAAHRVGDLGPTGRIPYPPDPLIGDPVPPAIPMPAMQIPIPSQTAPYLFLAGNIDGDGALVLARNTGVPIASKADLVGMTAIVDAAKVNDSIWVFSSGFAAEVGTDGILKQMFANSAYTVARGVSYNSESGLWICGSARVVFANPQTGMPIFEQGGVGSPPHDVVAIGPYAYATTGSVLVEISTASTIVRSSTGVSLRDSAGLAYDESIDSFWVVSRTPTAGLFLIPRSTFVATEVSLDFVSPSDFEWIEVIPGLGLYITMDDGGSRLIRVRSDGKLAEDRTFGGSGAGRVSIDSDGGVVWFACPGTGDVHGMAPTTISASAVTYSFVSAAPTILSFRA